MVAFCSQFDVEKRLRRILTTAEAEYLPGMIEEAQLLVVAFLGCGEDAYPTVDDVPAAVRVVTSRMVARVIEQAETTPPEMLGATQVGNTAGPFSQQVSFAQPRYGSPWLQRTDKETLEPYSCAGKAFEIDLAAGSSRAWGESANGVG